MIRSWCAHRAGTSRGFPGRSVRFHGRQSEFKETLKSLAMPVRDSFALALAQQGTAQAQPGTEEDARNGHSLPWCGR